MDIQPLKLNQKFLTLVGMCAPPDNTSIGKLLLYTSVGLYVFVTLCSDLISSSFFLIQYKRRDMEDVLGSMLQTAAVFSNIFSMITTFQLSKRLRGVFSLLQTIYNECNWSIYKRAQCAAHTHIFSLNGFGFHISCHFRFRLRWSDHRNFDENRRLL